MFEFYKELFKDEQWTKMYNLVVEKHKKQKDRGGKPYIEHLKYVMRNVSIEYKDPELSIIALGHDIVEDTDVTIQDLIDMNFSYRIVTGIKDVSKVNNETESEYYERVKSNIDAVKVKLFDLEHNMDFTRLKTITQRDIERLTKYSNRHIELTDILNDLY